MQPTRREFFVTELEARTQARLRLPSMSHFTGYDMLQDALNIVDLKNNIVFAAPSVEIYDIRGNLIFRDFTCLMDGGRELRVRTSADKIFGDPIIAFGVREKCLPIHAWVDAARSIFDASEISGVDTIVCHAYPRLGLMRTNGVGSWLIEFCDWSIRRLSDSTIWSPLEEIPTERHRDLAALWSAKAALMREREWSDFRDLHGRLMALQATVRRNVLTVKLEAQDDSWSCAPATGAMILDYHGIKVDEHGVKVDESLLHGAMSTMQGVGTLLNDELKGYKQLTQGKNFTISVDGRPTFEKAQKEIGVGVKKWPLKSGISKGTAQHARAIIGWETGPDGDYLYVNDPWPVANATGYGGNPTCETWNEVFHTDFVFIRP